MKHLVITAGATAQNVVLIVTDKEQGDILDDINQIVTIGRVPEIFSADEMKDIEEKTRVFDLRREKTMQTDGSAKVRSSELCSPLVYFHKI